MQHNGSYYSGYLFHDMGQQQYERRMTNSQHPHPAPAGNHGWPLIYAGSSTTVVRVGKYTCRSLKAILIAVDRLLLSDSDCPSAPQCHLLCTSAYLHSGTDILCTITAFVSSNSSYLSWTTTAAANYQLPVSTCLQCTTTITASCFPCPTVYLLSTTACESYR